MDEIFGFFPPIANPPSKGPLLTLLKQGRAAGVGMVLATQNPVDLDYKGLANIGTWWLGRLQTERDKARVLEGLESASDSGGLDRSEVDRLLSALTGRVFLMRNVHVAETDEEAHEHLTPPANQPRGLAQTGLSTSNRSVVNTLPTSTTNITGFLAIVRGWSLRIASTIAVRTIAGSQIDRDCVWARAAIRTPALSP